MIFIPRIVDPKLRWALKFVYVHRPTPFGNAVAQFYLLFGSPMGANIPALQVPQEINNMYVPQMQLSTSTYVLPLARDQECVSKLELRINCSNDTCLDY